MITSFIGVDYTIPRELSSRALQFIGRRDTLNEIKMMESGDTGRLGGEHLKVETELPGIDE